MVFLECHSGGVCLILFGGLGCQNLSRDQGRYLAQVQHVRYSAQGGNRIGGRTIVFV